MRKHIFCLCILLCLSALTSCAPDFSFHLNPSDYMEDFKAKNEILFDNTDCDHERIHSHINGEADPSVSALYHKTSCKWGNCDYDISYTPHIFLFDRDELPTSRAYYKENGSLYHSFRMACEECHASISLNVLCRTQDANCGAGDGAIHAPATCFIGCDWNEIFRDTLYRIVIKSDE